MLLNCLAVGCGGFVGSILRYLLGLVVPSSEFPVGTLAVNVVGSFLLAFIAGHAAAGLIADERASLLLRVGLCGGFTTFSTYSLEAMGLMSDGRAGLALAYMVATCGACLCASFAGAWASGVVRGA